MSLTAGNILTHALSSDDAKRLEELRYEVFGAASHLESDPTNGPLAQLVLAQDLGAHALHELGRLAEGGDFNAQTALRHSISHRAVYPGSFDPFTLGHKDVVKRAMPLFDEVVVAVLVNSGKSPIFSLEERIAIIKQDMNDVCENVRVVTFKGALVDLADDLNAPVILRGVREVTDFAHETGLALVNREQARGRIETLYIPAAPEISFVSSTVAKELVNLDLDLTRYLTPATTRALKLKLLAPKLEMEWDDACKKLGIALDDDAKAKFKELLADYTDPRRVYHDITHILRMLAAYHAVENKIEDAGALATMILFHDKVYEAASSHNEEQSANDAGAWLAGKGVAPERVGKIMRGIAATKKHDAAEGDFDMEILIDLDLAIFAASPSRYDNYARGIRAEYNHVGAPEYCAGRAAVLESFYNKRPLFKHPELLELDVFKARANLSREIAALRAGSIPSSVL